MDDKTLDMEIQSFKDRSTSIKILVRSLELRLQGKRWLGSGDKYSDGGTALCGMSVINKLTSLLQPFCEESNLITIKDILTFERQKFHTNKTMNAILMEDSTTTAQENRVIFEMFANTLQNIGDIILGSKAFMRDILSNNEEKTELGGI